MPDTPNVFGPGEYKCAMCGGVFQGDVSTEDSLAEVKANGWEHVPKEQMDVICEDCYQKMVAARPPRRFNKEVTGTEVLSREDAEEAEKLSHFLQNAVRDWYDQTMAAMAEMAKKQENSDAKGTDRSPGSDETNTPVRGLPGDPAT